ncbi:MAG: GNAT family N-acetyltransferase [candidate division Zixibacteria bacterium]
MEIIKDSFLISTDKEKLALEVIAKFLRSSYWAKGRSMDVIKKSIENSLCFGVYDNDKQIGFARFVTDYATFAWLADVFILDEYKGKGLGKWLMETIHDHPDLQTVHIWILATKDAHGLYARYGYELLDKPERLLRRKILKGD